MAQSNTDSMVDSSRSSESARGRAKDAARAEEQRQLEHDQRPDEPRRADAGDVGQALIDVDHDQLWRRWWQIQASFVDEPRNAVAEAHALVSGIVDGLVQKLEGQRADLERRWSSGQEISTEELRCDLQRYRDFLGSMLSRWEQGQHN